MERQDLGQAMSDAQRAFIDAAVALGARSPTTARPLADLPRIAARAIEELLDTGLVREGPPGTYYVYESSRRTAAAPDVTALEASSAHSWQRIAVTGAMWLVIMLLPFLFIRLTK